MHVRRGQNVRDVFLDTGSQILFGGKKAWICTCTIHVVMDRRDLLLPSQIPDLVGALYGIS